MSQRVPPPAETTAAATKHTFAANP
jgi:hypothetical protein